jgi:hypothetical protein
MLFGPVLGGMLPVTIGGRAGAPNAAAAAAPSA